MFRHALVKEAPTNAVIHGQGVVKVPISSAPLYVLVGVKDQKLAKSGKSACWADCYWAPSLRNIISMS
jgi:hypothetical protein